MTGSRPPTVAGRAHLREVGITLPRAATAVPRSRWHDWARTVDALPRPKRSGSSRSGCTTISGRPAAGRCAGLRAVRRADGDRRRDLPGAARHYVLAAAYRPAALGEDDLDAGRDTPAGGSGSVSARAGRKTNGALTDTGSPTLRSVWRSAADHLEIVSRMLRPRHATFAGRHASVDDALPEPKSAGGRIRCSSAATGPRSRGGWRPASRMSSTSTRYAGRSPGPCR